MGPAPLGSTSEYSTYVLVCQLFSLDLVILLVFAVLMVALLIAGELLYT